VPLAEAVRRRGGVYHACAAGETTWFGMAEEIVGRARAADPRARWARVLPIATAEYPTPAERPLNSRLNCERLARELGYRMPEWRASVAEVMAEMR
jgi:dTDP-4-dehydrorhamnose reductase